MTYDIDEYKLTLFFLEHLKVNYKFMKKTIYYNANSFFIIFMSKIKLKTNIYKYYYI